MKKQKRLSEKQTKVLNDLFNGNNSEIEVLKKHAVTTRQYRKWLSDGDSFADEFAFRVQAGKQSYV